MKFAYTHFSLFTITLVLLSCASKEKSRKFYPNSSECEFATDSRFPSYDCLGTMAYVHEKKLRHFLIAEDGFLIAMPKNLVPPKDTVWLIKEGERMSLVTEQDCKWSRIAVIDSGGKVIPCIDNEKMLSIVSTIPIGTNNTPLVIPDFKVLYDGASFTYKQKSTNNQKLMIKTSAGLYVVLPWNDKLIKGIYIIESHEDKSLTISKIASEHNIYSVVTIHSDRTIIITDKMTVSARTENQAVWNIIDEEGAPALPPTKLIISLLETPELVVHKDGLVSIPQQDMR